MATLTRLSDVLMPPMGEKPGAVQAQTPMFLDFLHRRLAGRAQAGVPRGLDWLDAEAKKRFNVEFAKLSDAQVDELLKPWLPHVESIIDPPAEKHADFINIAHDDIRTATVNSKAWFTVPEVARSRGRRWSFTGRPSSRMFRWKRRTVREFRRTCRPHPRRIIRCRRIHDRDRDQGLEPENRERGTRDQGIRNRDQKLDAE